MSIKSDQPTIPAGKLSAYERWELPTVNARNVVGKDALRSEEDLPVSPLTAEQVEEIREAARRDGFEQGQREGLAAGHAEGMAAAEAKLRDKTDQVQALIEQLLRPAQDEQVALEAALIDLVIQVSESVIGRELLVDSSVISGLVRDAVAVLPSGASRISIQVHPDDLATLEKSGLAFDQEWSLSADVCITPGGCRVTAGDSLIDYTVEQRFQSQVETLVQERYALVARLHGKTGLDSETGT